eukprot:643753_1
MATEPEETADSVVAMKKPTQNGESNGKDRRGSVTSSSSRSGSRSRSGSASGSRSGSRSGSASCSHSGSRSRSGSRSGSQSHSGSRSRSGSQSVSRSRSPLKQPAIAQNSATAEKLSRARSPSHVAENGPDKPKSRSASAEQDTAKATETEVSTKAKSVSKSHSKSKSRSLSKPKIQSKSRSKSSRKSRSKSRSKSKRKSRSKSGSISRSVSRPRASLRSRSRSRSRSGSRRHYSQERNKPHTFNMYVCEFGDDCVAKDLEEAFSQCGEVESCNIIMDHVTGRSRCYGFVNFGTEEARNAALALSEPTVKGKIVRIATSDIRTNVYLGNLPRGISEEELLEKLKEMVGLQPNEIRLKPGYCFLSFLTQADAETVVDKLRNQMISEHPLRVQLSTGRKEDRGGFRRERDGDFGGRRNEADPCATLYISGLSGATDEDAVRDNFGKHGNVIRISLIKDMDNRPRGFAFVEYDKESSATEARGELDGKEIDGRFIRVQYARPHRDSRRNDDDGDRFGRGGPRGPPRRRQRSRSGGHGGGGGYGGGRDFDRGGGGGGGRYGGGPPDFDRPPRGAFGGGGAGAGGMFPPQPFGGMQPTYPMPTVGWDEASQQWVMLNAHQVSQLKIVLVVPNDPRNIDAAKSVADEAAALVVVVVLRAVGAAAAPADLRREALRESTAANAPNGPVGARLLAADAQARAEIDARTISVPIECPPGRAVPVGSAGFGEAVLAAEISVEAVGGAVEWI